MPCVAASASWCISTPMATIALNYGGKNSKPAHPGPRREFLWIWYLVKVYDFPSIDDVSETQTAIISCECPEFMKHELKCKHMFLASRITGSPIQHLTVEVATQATTQSPPPDSMPSDAVVLEKEATVRCIQEEIATISQLSQTLSSVNLGQTDRPTLIGLETQATRLRRDLSASVSNRPMHATQEN
ncbi:hypothetical protein C8J57DRAFT_1229863 [Mycena rebaudengoi]|nr:hypothetical protein C8J57DRAFT_1229863 [Mycena rebaudengoi]